MASTEGLDAAVSGFADLARRLAAGSYDPAWLNRRLEFVDSRLDLSDHRLVMVLKLVLAGGEHLTEEQQYRIRSSVIGFRYWWDEPGHDSMCQWSENHQVLFSVCEYLAGQLYPDSAFADGRRGNVKRERAAARLHDWMGNRFRYGFSEWLSNTYYELDIVALTLLADYADDPDLVARATMVLDLLVLDLALHRCHGRFVASAGRAYAQQKAHPDKAEINQILHAFFGPQPAFQPERLSAIVVDRVHYLVPAVLMEIARHQGASRIETSQGIDVAEVADEVSRRRDLTPDQRRDAMVRLYWSMEAFAHPQAIGLSLEEYRRHGLEGNRFLTPMSRFAAIHSERAAAAMARAIHPVQTGAALQRADVQTYRTPQYILSSAQRYHPGEFGDQQSLWIAGLPDNICVFGTHPGATMMSGEARPTTPSAWVGNGINPDIGQHDNVLLVLHDTRGRRGYLEGRRHQLSHVYFPFAQFDETSLGRNFVAARKGDVYIGIASLAPLEMVSEVEVLQRGAVTGWVVIVSDPGEYGSYGHLLHELKTARVQLHRDRMIWHGQHHYYSLRWKGDFTVDGAPVTSDYARLECEWATVPRHPSVITVKGRTGQLRLDWNLGRRELG